MKTHICLVSAQAAANLLPALDGNLKPEKIVLVVTAKMRRQADNLTKVFKENAIKVEFLELGYEQDFHRTENELMELATRLEGETVTLNITGGTKLMSVAAQSVATASDWRMFYVDADSDQVIWLGRDEAAPQPLQQQLKLRHYLQSYGFSFVGKPDRASPTPLQRQLTQTLAQHVGSLKDAIANLNALAQDAENRHSLSVQLNAWQRDNPSFGVLLRHFEDAQALHLNGDTIHFGSDEQRDFVKGGWLELHAMDTVNQVTGDLQIRDKAVGLEVIDDASKTKNELDIAFMARNRLFVIECKTARIDKPQGSTGKLPKPKANDTLFKLAENCRRIGGHATRGMLVSYRKLGEAELRLAKALNIEVVSGPDIARLSEKLKQWIST